MICAICRHIGNNTSCQEYNIRRCIYKITPHKEESNQCNCYNKHCKTIKPLQHRDPLSVVFYSLLDARITHFKMQNFGQGLLRGIATWSVILRETVVALEKMPKNEVTSVISFCVLTVLLTMLLIFVYIIVKIAWFVLSRVLYYTIRSWKQRKCMQMAKNKVVKYYMTLNMIKHKDHTFVSDVMTEYRQLMGIHQKKK